MPKKYIIALIPTSKGEDVVSFTQNFSRISDQYQLGNESLPHVTLCQFHAEEKDIDRIWNNVCKDLSEHTIELEFKDFSCITFNNTIFWVSLMPNQRSTLNEMHQAVADSIKAPINKSYDPHMTLINTKNPEYKKMANDLSKSYTPIKDTFILSIGECDAIGQYTKLLHKSELNTKKLRCKM